MSCSTDCLNHFFVLNTQVCSQWNKINGFRCHFISLFFSFIFTIIWSFTPIGYFCVYRSEDISESGNGFLNQSNVNFLNQLDSEMFNVGKRKLPQNTNIPPEYNLLRLDSLAFFCIQILPIIIIFEILKSDILVWMLCSLKPCTMYQWRSG